MTHIRIPMILLVGALHTGTVTAGDVLLPGEKIKGTPRDSALTLRFDMAAGSCSVTR